MGQACFQATLLDILATLQAEIFKRAGPDRCSGCFLVISVFVFVAILQRTHKRQVDPLDRERTVQMQRRVHFLRLVVSIGDSSLRFAHRSAYCNGNGKRRLAILCLFSANVYHIRTYSSCYNFTSRLNGLSNTGCCLRQQPIFRQKWFLGITKTFFRFGACFCNVVFD